MNSSFENPIIFSLPVNFKSYLFLSGLSSDKPDADRTQPDGSSVQSVDGALVSTTKPKEGAGGDQAEEEAEDDEITVLFSKRATLSYIPEGGSKPVQMGMGELKITYDDDVCGGRVQLTTDQGKMICNHIICRKYRLKL